MVLLIQIKNQRIMYHFRHIHQDASSYKSTSVVNARLCKNNFIIILFNFNDFYNSNIKNMKRTFLMAKVTISPSTKKIFVFPLLTYNALLLRHNFFFRIKVKPSIYFTQQLQGRCF